MEVVPFQINILVFARQPVVLSKAATVSFGVLRLLRMAVAAASKHDKEI
jgi:hypothetical protein